MKYFFIALALSVITIGSFGQADSSEALRIKKRYASAEISFPYLKVRDMGFSPLLYKGITTQLYLYNEKVKDNSWSRLEIGLNGGVIAASKKQVIIRYSSQAFKLDVNYHYLVNAGKIKNKIQCYIGGLLTNTIEGRLYLFLPNNSFGYEFSNAISPEALFINNYTLGKRKRSYETGFRINVAALAHVVRPNYIDMEPYQTYNGETINGLAIFTHGNTIALPNRFFRINSELYLDRSGVKNNNKTRIFYRWGVHIVNLTTTDPLYYAYHSLGVTRMLYSEKKLKKRKIKIRSIIDFHEK
jgi:hypothetical protein